MLNPRILAGALTLASVVSAAAQTFNFDSGSDAGLTRYNPLSPFGVGASYSFPGGNTYRVNVPSSAPFTGSVGPGRGGAFIPGNQTDFMVSVDLVDWNDSLSQGFGPAARVGQIGLGTTDGYSFAYVTSVDIAIIQRFDNEVGTGLSLGAVTLNPALDYRMVFSGVGSTLTGSIYALSDLGTPLVTVTTTDATYGSGSPGILVSTTVSAPTGASDATFDNFTAVPEPGEYAAVAGGASGRLRVVASAAALSGSLGSGQGRDTAEGGGALALVASMRSEEAGWPSGLPAPYHWPVSRPHQSSDRSNRGPAWRATPAWRQP